MTRINAPTACVASSDQSPGLESFPALHVIALTSMEAGSMQLYGKVPIVSAANPLLQEFDGFLQDVVANPEFSSDQRL